MTLVEMTIDSIRHGMLKDNWAIILKAKVGQRYLPIWVGCSEADAIAVKLQGVSTPRPLTHDLLRSLIDVFGASVRSVIISEFKINTFYAKIVLTVGDKKLEVDCRPSDGLALAVRAEAPIFAEEAVLNKAGTAVGA